MRKLGICLALTGVTALMTGCGSSGSAPATSRGGLAVVDLDKVAAETGRKAEMDEQYKMTASSVQQQLVSAQNNFQGQIDAKAKELGIDLTTKKPEEIPEEAKQQVGQMTLNARNILARAQNEYGAKLGEYKQTQIAKFRNDLKPVLQEVAAKRGLSIVVPKNEGLLLAVDPGVDITDDVIKAYREKKPAVAATAPAAAPAAPAASTAPAKPAPKTAAKDADAEKK